MIYQISQVNFSSLADWSICLACPSLSVSSTEHYHGGNNTIMGKFGIGTHRTTIAQDNGSTVVTYHRTRVVSFNDKSINLRDGGYQTVTTKRRINEVSVTFGLGLQVYQTNFDWFVKHGGNVYSFHDRMTLDRLTRRAYNYDGTEIMPIASSVDGIGIAKWVTN